MSTPALVKAVQPDDTIFAESPDPDDEHIWMIGTIGGRGIAPRALCGFKYDGRNLSKLSRPGARKCKRCLDAEKKAGQL